MILVHGVSLPLETDFSDLRSAAAKTLRLPVDRIVNVGLYRKSVDARHKNDVHFCCTLSVTVQGDEQALLKKCPQATLMKEETWQQPYFTGSGCPQPVVIGFGPAGLFAALTLARAGLSPIVLERGRDVDRRTTDVKTFMAGGVLDPVSNVQFGEGGAGTFSDGKLNSGIKDLRCRHVMKSFVEFGAPEKILIDAKPHIGTDILRDVVKNIRHEIIRLSGRVLFETQVTGLIIRNGRLCGVKTAGGEQIECDGAVLATGHSARDTFTMLKEVGVAMERKPFSVGARIEHLQQEINRSLYGSFAFHPALSAADYRLAVHPDGRGVYTFCMCPGGQVINASSEPGGLAVNGMSYAARNGQNANSAVLVSVTPDDLPGQDVLAGVAFQRMIEQRAYQTAGGAVPITTVGHFLYGDTAAIGRVKPSVKPQTAFCEPEQIMPDFVLQSMKKALPMMDRSLAGFADKESLLTWPETRSSSPVRVIRNEDGQSVTLPGLYPAGEGCGYAGGILSAAVDGIRAAEHFLNRFSKENI